MKLYFMFIPVLLLVFSYCSNENQASGKNMKVFYYKAGQKTEVNVKDEKIVSDLVTKIVEKADEEIRLYVDEERVADLKSNDALLEFEFNKENKILAKWEINFNRLIIAIDGDLSMGGENVVILTGLNEYDTTPQLTKNTLKYLNQLLKELKLN